MSANTKIEWADHTFNPWMGCQKVSPACDHCYAEVNTAVRSLGVKWGPGAERRRTSAGNWNLPFKWNDEAARLGIRYRVFCASLADVFDNAVYPAWRADLFFLIEQTPNLDWLLLTKRIGNVKQMVADASEYLSKVHRPLAWPLPNVWLGATICNQEEANRDIPKLLAVPAAKRFLSMEPLLGPVDLREAHLAPVRLPRVDWVIVGGESGHHARPMHPDWARSLRDQCEAAGVPFLFKQWGEWGTDGRIPMLVSIHEKSHSLTLDGKKYDGPSQSCPKGTAAMLWMGKKVAGRMLDGRTWDGVPA